MGKQKRTWNTKREYIEPIWAKAKTRYCPECSNELALVEYSKVVNSNSPESDDFDFSFAGGASSGARAFGRVKFIWDEFKCSVCNIRIPIEELKKYERYLNRQKARRTSE